MLLAADSRDADEGRSSAARPTDGANATPSPASPAGAPTPAAAADAFAPQTEPDRPAPPPTRDRDGGREMRLLTQAPQAHAADEDDAIIRHALVRTSGSPATGAPWRSDSRSARNDGRSPLQGSLRTLARSYPRQPCSGESRLAVARSRSGRRRKRFLMAFPSVRPSGEQERRARARAGTRERCRHDSRPMHGTRPGRWAPCSGVGAARVWETVAPPSASTGGGPPASRTKGAPSGCYAALRV